MPKIFLKLIWIVISSLALCEGVVRIWGIWPSYVVAGKGIGNGFSKLKITLDEEMLFRPLPSSDLGINSLGFRNEEFDQLSARRRVIVLGDSFPMGLAVAPNQTFPKQLEKLLNQSIVYNFGVQGYGPDQELLSFKKYGLPLKPTTVILSLYPSNDFNDIIKNDLFYLDGESLKQKHPNPIEKILPRFRFLMALQLFSTGHILPKETEASLDSLLFQDKNLSGFIDPADEVRSIKILSAILTSLKTLASTYAFDFHVLIIPSFDEIQGEGKANKKFTMENKVVELGREQELSILDLTPVFLSWKAEPLYLEGDRHLSEAGHKLSAKLLADFLAHFEPSF